MVRQVVQFKSVKACTCDARGTRQAIYSLALEDAGYGNREPDDVTGTEYALFYYLPADPNSLVVCRSCNTPWRTRIEVNNQVLHEGDEGKFLKELALV